MDGVIGYVTLFAGTFPPRNWAFCKGQVLPINTNLSLFSIIGTFYGGNGQTTFALPDLQGRTAVGVGQGPGLSFYSLGQQTGTENTTLIITQMPPHSHPVNVTITPAAATTGTTTSPVDGVYANTTERAYSPSADAYGRAYPVDITTSYEGHSQPFSIQQPYLTLNYVICMAGEFPRRN
jgi:microcystin-dependent protein